MKRFLLMVAFLCAGALATVAERPMTFEDVVGLKVVSAPQLSPDGRWVMYGVSEADLKENQYKQSLWRTSVEGGAPRKLAEFDGVARWSPDGRRLALLASRGGSKGQIYLLWADGGEAEKLTDSKSPITTFEWSPDGRRLAYLASEPLSEEEEKKQKERDDAKLFDKDHRMSHLWLVDVESKKTERVTRGAGMSVSEPRWSPDGRHLAFVVRPSPRPDDSSLADIWMVSMAGGPAWQFTRNEGPDLAPRWSSDGRQLAYLSREGGLPMIGNLRLVVTPFGREAQPRSLTDDVDGSPGDIAWSADGRALYFTLVTRTTVQVFSVPAAGGPARQLSQVEGVISALDVGRQGMVFLLSEPARPAEVFYSGLASFSPRQLTDTNPQAKDFALGRAEVVRWKSRDGMEMEGLVLYPASYQAGRRYPLLVYAHGGPAGVYLKSFYAGWANAGQVWAGKGWVCFYPNFRGSTGYGEKFLQANFRDWGRGDFEDILSGIDHLVARGLADPERLALTGWSYGGYMTAWSITQTDRYKAAVAGAALTNMFSMYSTNDLQRVLDTYFGSQPWDNPEAYLNASAMTHIKRARTPTLILHGEADRRVPISQGQELRMGLLKKGVPTDMAVYPRAGHGLTEPLHQLDKLRREYAWIAEHTLGEKMESAEPKRVAIPPARFERLARIICDRLALQAGERVLLHSDPTYYPELAEELRKEIHRRGAMQVANLSLAGPELARLRAQQNRRAEKNFAEREDAVVRALFDVSDVYLWLPVRALEGQLRSEPFLENWNGRAIHFHWVFDPDNLPADLVGRLVAMYEQALEVEPAQLAARQDRLIAGLRAGPLRLTTPAGTDLRLTVGDRRFHKNDGVASRERVADARSVRDREIELPAGALRVIPLEDSAEGTLVAPQIAVGGKTFRQLRLRFAAGRLTGVEGPEAEDFLTRWRQETGDRDRVGELVFGTNPVLTRIPGSDFLPYFGYGAGVVRVSLGDNWESGGQNRSSFHFWVLLDDATVEAAGRKLIDAGRLVEP